MGPPDPVAAAPGKWAYTNILPPGERPGTEVNSFASAAPVLRSFDQTRLRSDQLVRPQEIIGLDDLAQFVFRRTVAAVGVGMVALHQLLVFRFDGDFGGLAVEFERKQRLQRQRVVARGLRRVAGSSGAFAPHRARLGIDGLVDVGRAVRPGAWTHLPGGAMPDRFRGAILCERVVVHALEIIVSRVVLAHVVLADAEVLAFVVAPLGRLEDALGLATGMAADGRGHLRRWRRGVFARRFYADTIEEGCIEIHD